MPARSEREVKTGLRTRDLPCGRSRRVPGCEEKEAQPQKQPEAVPGAGGLGSGTDAWEGDGWMWRVGRAVEGVGWEGEADDLGTGEGGCRSRCFSHRILVLDNVKRSLEAR